MTRIKAFLIHLGISAAIFIILLYFIIFQWYPSFLFSTDGGWQGVRIIAGVDLVLGPLLTLIVFKAGKPSLKMDLSIIALIQAAALTWGVWVTYHERPYTIIYYENYFIPVSKHHLEENSVPVEKVDELSSGERPRLIYTNLPLFDHEKMSILRREAKTKQQPLYLWHDYYDSFKAEYMPMMQHESLDLDFILSKEDKLSKNIKKKINHYTQLKENYLFHMLDTRSRRTIAVFNTLTYKITDTIDFDPTDYLYIIRKPKKTPDK